MYVRTLVRLILFLALVSGAIFGWKRASPRNPVKKWILEQAFGIELAFSGGADKVLADLEEDLAWHRKAMKDLNRQVKHFQDNAPICRATGKRRTVRIIDDPRPEVRKKFGN